MSLILQKNSKTFMRHKSHMPDCNQVFEHFSCINNILPSYITSTSAELRTATRSARSRKTKRTLCEKVWQGETLAASMAKLHNPQFGHYCARCRGLL